MAFGRQKNSEAKAGSLELGQPLESYDVTYRGGLPELPKSKVGKISMEIHTDRFKLKPTTTTKKFWSELEIPYNTISNLEVVERNVSTFEGLAGGLNSRQLNQKNNIHIAYSGLEGEMLLRLEMLSGVTVMGQAKKCNEFEDRLRNFRIREQFVANTPVVDSSSGSLSDELKKLASLKADGVLTEEEFAAAKARLLGA